MLTGCHTCFQQHYLIVLTQLHEAVDALGELHHILNGLCYFDSTQLPHDFPGLRTERKRERVIYCKRMFLIIAAAADTGTDPGPWSGYLALVALHLLLQEGLPGHLLQLLPQVLTCLHVWLGDVLGQVLCNKSIVTNAEDHSRDLGVAHRAVWKGRPHWWNVPQEKKIYLLSLQKGGEADARGLFWLGKGLLTFPFTACRKLIA